MYQFFFATFSITFSIAVISSLSIIVEINAILHIINDLQHFSPIHLNECSNNSFKIEYDPTIDGF